MWSKTREPYGHKRLKTKGTITKLGSLKLWRCTKCLTQNIRPLVKQLLQIVEKNPGIKSARVCMHQPLGDAFWI